MSKEERNYLAGNGVFAYVETLRSLTNKGNWRARWLLTEASIADIEKLIDKALNSKYRTPFLDEIKNEFFILRLKGEI